MKIDVITCSRDPQLNFLHRQNVLRTSANSGFRVGYHRIDNSAGTMGICAAYNRGIEQSRADILVFMHEDAFFDRDDWTQVLVDRFTSNAGLVMLGVAGASKMSAELPLWFRAGKPFVHGSVIHDLQDQNRKFKTIYGPACDDVLCVDGVFMAVRKSALSSGVSPIHFDATTFPGFHLYDMDFSMQMQNVGQIAVEENIVIRHLSGGAYGDAWKQAAAAFVNKFQGQLPKVSKTAETFDASAFSEEEKYAFENVDL